MNEPEKRTFTITEGPEAGVSIDANDVVHLLVTAFDSGATNYWADYADVDLPEGFDIANVLWLNDKDFWSEVRKVYIAPLLENGKVILFGNIFENEWVTLSDNPESVRIVEGDDEDGDEDGDEKEFAWTWKGECFRRPRYTLNLASIERGLNSMSSKYRDHWHDFRTRNDDSETGDVFVQCCIFGEVL